MPAPGGGGDCAAGNPAAFLHRQELGLAGLACVVKVYDFREGQVKLNETVEFVGVLGYDDALSPPEGGAAREGEEETGGEAGMVSGNPFQGLEDFSRKVPPPSLAPRLHCICEEVVLRGAQYSGSLAPVYESIGFTTWPSFDPMVDSPHDKALHSILVPIHFLGRREFSQAIGGRV